jgi:uncharacterized protein (DUF1697 family)
MALVVLLKGLNVGGHRAFRPSTVAKRLKRFGVINVGAAGTFVVRKSVSRRRLRSAIRRLLPFEAEIILCDGRDIVQLVSQKPYADQLRGPGIIRFVSVLARRGASRFRLPHEVPASGRWVVRVLAQQGRFVLGLHRREMKAIGHLAQVEKALGGPMTTRSWSTILTLARLVESV